MQSEEVRLVCSVSDVRSQKTPEDLVCGHCAYLLRGLLTDGVCPECGTPIAHALRSNLLADADVAWLAKLKVGIDFFLASMIAGVLVAIAGGTIVTVGWLSYQPIAKAMNFILCVLYLIGLWRVTTPEPRLVPLGLSRLQLFLRILPVTQLAGEVTTLIGETILGNIWIEKIGSLLSLAYFLSGVAVWVLVRDWARRIPSERLANRATVIAWGLGISFLVMVGIGGLLSLYATPNAANAGTSGVILLGALSVCVSLVMWLIFGIMALILLLTMRTQISKAMASSARSA